MMKLNDLECCAARIFTTYTSYRVLLGYGNVGGSEGLVMCCNEGDSV